jgi:hypothetical protein
MGDGMRTFAIHRELIPGAWTNSFLGVTLLKRERPVFLL